MRRFIKSFKLISATIFLHHEKFVKALDLIIFRAIHELLPLEKQLFGCLNKTRKGYVRMNEGGRGKRFESLIKKFP